MIKPKIKPRSNIFYENTYEDNANNVYILKNATRSDQASLPVPPPPLMQYRESEQAHLKLGKLEADNITNALSASGIDINTFNNVLEFGCSNGRILRHFEEQAVKNNYWGCDINSNTVTWAKENLSPPFNFFINTTFPNLPIEQNSLDFVFAISIFSHMDDLFFAWLLELRRTLKKGGYAFISFLDENSINFGLEHPDYPIGRQVSTAVEPLTALLNGENNMVVVNRDTHSHTFVRRSYLTQELSNLFSVVSVHEKAVAFHQTAFLLQK